VVIPSLARHPHRSAITGPDHTLLAREPSCTHCAGRPLAASQFGAARNAHLAGDRFGHESTSHLVIAIHGRKADVVRKGERTREQITDLMAGGEAMADLESELAEL
jgi:hypothetical protein